MNIGDALNEKVHLKLLDPNLFISTMTITCGFETMMIIENIERYIKLSMPGIITVIPLDGPVRTLVEYTLKDSKRTGKKKTENKAFDNQVTLIVETATKKRLNVKLFLNGSIQMTGCKLPSDIISVVNTLVRQLTTNRYVYDRKTKLIQEVHFVTDPDKVNSDNVEKFEIQMINSNFASCFEIDRTELYEILLRNDINCLFEPCIHAGVNIKYDCGQRQISIFVFESGSVVITGARQIEDIQKTYKFIIKLFYEHYHSIIRYNIDSFFKRDYIQKIINEHVDIDD